MKTRSLLCILISILMLTQLAVPAFAAEPDAAAEPAEMISEAVSVTGTVCPDTDLPDNDELFSLYVDQQLYGYAFSTFGTKARERLSAADQEFYDVLKAKIEAVAENGGSTRFTLNDLSWLKTSWTNTELGVESIDDLDAVAEIFLAQFDANAILTALLDDCPFDLYWFDKTGTGGFASGYSYSYSQYNNGTKNIITKVTFTKMNFVFYVSADYQGGSNTAVTSNVAKVKTARTNAAKLVADCEAMSDYEKLAAYKDYILHAVEYNQAALDNDAPYGDPWQLINVFDGDSSTNVVCEGYSKALQYLCDLSGLDCICADGYTNGNHMWNVVTLDGSNYLVDLTNCDGNNIGAPDLLFLVGGTYLAGDTDDSGQYCFTLHGQPFIYICPDLNLSAIDYVPSAAPALYTVTVDAGIENGTVSASHAQAEAGTEITLTATPAEGYMLESLSATYGENQSLEISGGSFIMPAADVTVTAGFAAHTHSYGTDGKCTCGAECDHTAAVTAVPNDDGLTHRILCACGQNVVTEAEAHSTTAEGDIVPDCFSTGYCSVCESHYTPGHDVQDEICVRCELYGTCGEDAVWEFDPETAALTVSGTGTADGYSWRKHADTVRTLIVEEGITRIGSRMFMNCVSLSDIFLPDSLLAIDSMAFAYCDSMTEFTVPQGVTTISGDAFIGCYNLRTFRAADHNPVFTAADGVLFSKDMTMLVSFPAGKSATSYRVPDTVTVIGSYAFHQCTELVSIVLPENLMCIGTYAFNGCFGLSDAHYLGDLENVTICDSNDYRGDWENLVILGNNAYLTDVLHGCSRKDAVPGSCTTPGHEAGWYCEICEEYFSGAETEIDPNAHEYAGGSCIHCGADAPTSIIITAQPVDYVGLVGDTAEFTVAAEGENLKYQWYYFDTAAQNWMKSSCKEATLRIEFLAYRSNQQYRCEITDSKGNLVISDVVKLTPMPVALAITEQPVSYVGAVNDDVTFPLTATGNGLTYQWFYSDNAGATWTKSGTPGFNTASLHPILRSYRDGYLYYCQITDIFGNSVTSDVVSMTVRSGEITIHTQPEDIDNGVLNELQTFAVSASGVNLEYRWEYSDNNGETWQLSWNSGYNTDTLTVRLYAYRSGYLYRCKITSGLKTVVYSAPAALSLQAPSAVITKHPAKVAVVAGKTAEFRVEATGNNLTYQWYRSNDNGATWILTYLSGYNTDTLSFTANAARSALYKCKITDGSGKTVWSNNARLQLLSAALKILSQPKSMTCANGAAAVFAVEAQGDSLNYRWYSSSDGSNWDYTFLTGYNTERLSFTVTTARAAKLYKCIITDAGGNTVETNAVSVTIG